jgi:hypothetical protein
MQQLDQFDHPALVTRLAVDVSRCAPPAADLSRRASANRNAVGLEQASTSA